MDSKKQSKTLSIKRTSEPLQLSNQRHILGFANELKRFIVDQKLSCDIKGNQYANVDGWKYAGLNFGLVGDPDEPIPMHKDGETFTVLYKEVQRTGKNGSFKTQSAIYAGQVKEEIDRLEKAQNICRKEVIPLYKYKCKCDIKNIATREGMSKGFAICTNMELSKVSFEEYAIGSMAQTRAIGKGFKNILGFVMKAAGFEPTPAEEMDDKNKGKKGSDRDVIKFDSQVKEQIELMNTTDELRNYWNQLPELHDNDDFKKAINKRREEILSQQKSDMKNTKTGKTAMP